MRPRSLPALLALLLPLLAAAPSRAETPACPDILLGDSLAVGMAPHARAAGFQVIAEQGAGLAWLRRQPPRCARRLVLVLGTNDLRGMTEDAASAYLAGITAAMERWDTLHLFWATPGCFPRDAALEQGSVAMDRAIGAAVDGMSYALRSLPAVHRGRLARCDFASPDGVHPAASVYRAWWEGLAQVLRRTGLAAN
jgi:hypothetical protein